MPQAKDAKSLWYGSYTASHGVQSGCRGPFGEELGSAIRTHRQVLERTRSSPGGYEAKIYGAGTCLSSDPWFPLPISGGTTEIRVDYYNPRMPVGLPTIPRLLGSGIRGLWLEDVFRHPIGESPGGLLRGTHRTSRASGSWPRVTHSTEDRHTRGRTVDRPSGTTRGQTSQQVANQNQLQPFLVARPVPARQRRSSCRFVHDTKLRFVAGKRIMRVA